MFRECVNCQYRRALARSKVITSKIRKAAAFLFLAFSILTGAIASIFYIGHRWVKVD